MQTSLDLIPRYSLPLVAIMLATIVVSYLVIRLATGPAVSLARRWGLLATRLTLIVLLIALLSNPVHVAERPGAREPADVFVALDASQSMALADQGQTRWEQGLDMIRGSMNDASGPINANLSLFRFGRRLEAIADPRALGISPPDRAEDESPQAASPNTAVSSSGDEPAPAAKKLEPIKPDEPDTQLLVALRQMTSRFGRRPPAAVVVFSDGRARDAETADEVAAYYKRLGVPIHVSPLGDAGKGGDVSVVSLVAPATIRKHSLVNVHAFVRSYGYTGQRAEVELWSVGANKMVHQKLDSAPVTLADGFQSVNLSFQSDEDTRNLRALVQPREDEISSDNNQFDTDVRVDRTKIRVLYVEGSPMRLTTVQRAGQLVARGPHSSLQEALEDDLDIECTVLSISGARVGGTLNAFPVTSAELAAYDGIVLSGVPSSAFTDEQLAWIDDWIGKRGAGLCMVGGALSYAGGGWDRSPLERILPVQFGQGGSETSQRTSVQPVLSEPLHPIFRLLDDQRRNRELLQAFPAIGGMHADLKIRPNVATVLATGGEGNFPAITAGRYGRGRTVAIAFPIVPPAAEEFVNWGPGSTGSQGSFGSVLRSVGGAFGSTAQPIGNQYYNRFCRNMIYWLTENSFIGRRRLAAVADKRFYEPGETIVLSAAAFDEAANSTTAYRLAAMIEPQSLDVESDHSLVRWPSGMERKSGEEGPPAMWGEEFEIPVVRSEDGQSRYQLALQLAEAHAMGQSNGGMRLELTAYEGSTQLDSMSLPLQVVYDPFEQQNPFPNHDLLGQLAAKSGGHAISTPGQLAEVLRNVPVTTGPAEVRKTPAWSNWWLLGGLLGVLTIEWCWRRRIGLA